MIGGRIGAYEVVSELGSRGRGTVDLGTCAEAAAGLDECTEAALKVIHPHLPREAQVRQEVQNENVVRT